MYEVGRRNITWWEASRDRDRDGLFEYADTRFPQPWESGYDGSPRFDTIGTKPFPCVDLNAQLVLYYRNLLHFAIAKHDQEGAREFAKQEDRLTLLMRQRLYDPATRWFFDRTEKGFVRVKTVAGFWPLIAGILTAEQTDDAVARLEDPKQFATWFPLPSVAADEPKFEPVSWRGLCAPAQALWVATGLRHMGRTEEAGRLIRRTLDAMAEVLERDGTIYEFYNPSGPDQSGLKLFDFAGKGEPVRRYYLGQAPVRAMVLTGLFGIEPTGDGLLIDPAEESLPDDARVEFRVGENALRLETRRTKSGIEVTLDRGRETVATGVGKMLIPRVELL
jgi:hypothetical protein